MSDGATTWSCAIASRGTANVKVNRNANEMARESSTDFFIFPPRKTYFGGLVNPVYRETFGGVNGFETFAVRAHFDAIIFPRKHRYPERLSFRCLCGPGGSPNHSSQFACDRHVDPMLLCMAQDWPGDRVHFGRVAGGDVLLHRTAPSLRRFVEELDDHRSVERCPACRAHGGDFASHGLQPLSPHRIAIHFADSQPRRAGRERKRGKK